MIIFREKITFNFSPLLPRTDSYYIRKKRSCLCCSSSMLNKFYAWTRFTSSWTPLSEQNFFKEKSSREEKKRWNIAQREWNDLLEIFKCSNILSLASKIVQANWSHPSVAFLIVTSGWNWATLRQNATRIILTQFSSPYSNIHQAWTNWILSITKWLCCLFETEFRFSSDLSCVCVNCALNYPAHEIVSNSCHCLASWLIRMWICL